MGKGRPFGCPYCGSRTTISNGRRVVRNGIRRIRWCKACHRKFTPKSQKTIPITSSV